MASQIVLSPLVCPISLLLFKLLCPRLTFIALLRELTVLSVEELALPPKKPCTCKYRIQLNQNTSDWYHSEERAWPLGKGHDGTKMKHRGSGSILVSGWSYLVIS